MAVKLNENMKAPDFELLDTRGEKIKLSSYLGKPVVLVLLRGFV